MPKPFSPVVLLIFDGFGITEPGPGNAPSQANMPNYTNFTARYAHGQLQASGDAVGLTPGEVGSTEVGHLNLGAGRVVYQDLPRINMSIAEGTFLQIPAFVEAALHVRKNNSQLHIMGLVSSGNVHASIEHLYALLWFARDQGLPKEKVKIHAFLDGRDTPPTSAAMFLAQLEEKIRALNAGEIATLSGRYYAMDRDNRWDRIEKAYNAIVNGVGDQATLSSRAIEASYQKGITDEFVVPTVIVNEQGNPVGKVQPGDAIIHFNFRTDRPRELIKPFVIDDFNHMPMPTKPGAATTEQQYYKTFERGPKIENLFVVTMTEYERNLPVSGIAFPQEKIQMPLARVLSNNSKRHLHIAESEKERFTTFFFNGMREDPFEGEERVFVPSPKVPTYDLKPEMSSFEITEALLKRLELGSFDFAVMNFAASDMVGHTGNLQAAIKACEALDKCLGQIVNAVISKGGAVALTADHGNVEEMIDPATGGPNTEHSGNPVPFLVCGNGIPSTHIPSGILADVSPTILALMGIQKPQEMTGRNLLSQILR